MKRVEVIRSYVIRNLVRFKLSFHIQIIDNHSFPACQWSKKHSAIIFMKSNVCFLLKWVIFQTRRPCFHFVMGCVPWILMVIGNLKSSKNKLFKNSIDFHHWKEITYSGVSARSMPKRNKNITRKVQIKFRCCHTDFHLINQNPHDSARPRFHRAFQEIRYWSPFCIQGDILISVEERLYP